MTPAFVFAGIAAAVGLIFCLVAYMFTPTYSQVGGALAIAGFLAAMMTVAFLLAALGLTSAHSDATYHRNCKIKGGVMSTHHDCIKPGSEIPASHK